MVGKLAVEELLGTVGFAGIDEEVEGVVEGLFGDLELLPDEAAFGVGFRDDAVDGCAFGGGSGDDGEGGAVAEEESVELDDGGGEGGEVGAEAGAVAVGMVGAEGGDGSGEGGVGGEDEGVVGVDGVEKLGADGGAYAEREVGGELDGQGGAYGQGDGGWWGLAEEVDWQEEGEQCDDEQTSGARWRGEEGCLHCHLTPMLAQR